MDPDDSTKFKTMLKVRPDAICRNCPVIIDLEVHRGRVLFRVYPGDPELYYHVSAAMYLEA